MKRPMRTFRWALLSGFAGIGDDNARSRLTQIAGDGLKVI